MSITVVSTARNAWAWAERCIKSVGGQTVRARHIYIDAASDDGTANVVRSLLAGRPLELVHNETARPVLENLRDEITQLDPNEIVVWLDGDDWLATDYALERVQFEYDNTNAWLTYGQFIWSRGMIGMARPHSDEVVERGDFKTDHWKATHLKTFYAGLFQRIPVEHLNDANGNWFDLCCDQAVMLPMLEMARERARFIPEILMVYNHEHSFEVSASTQEREREMRVLREVRAKPKLDRLDFGFGRHVA